MRDSFPEEIAVIINGRANAIAKHAEAFNPMVFVKMSMLIPRTKESNNSIQRGVENGSKRMK